MILAPSSYTVQKLIDIQAVPAAKIQRLPWPLDPEFLKLAQSPSSLPLPSSFPNKDGPVILTARPLGRCGKIEGADDLIRAVAKLRASHPSLSLVLVGAGDDRPRLKSIAVAEHLGDSGGLPRNLPRAELAACYAHADVFALPSTGEGFGLVFLEAMAFAKPVVGVSSGGTLDLIRDGKNGLLIPPTKENPEVLVSALDRLVRDQNLRAEMGRAGQAWSPVNTPSRRSSNLWSASSRLYSPKMLTARLAGVLLGSILLVRSVAFRAGRARSPGFR